MSYGLSSSAIGPMTGFSYGTYVHMHPSTDLMIGDVNQPTTPGLALTVGGQSMFNGAVIANAPMPALAAQQQQQ